MRKLIVQQWISLDGFANDKNDKLDFFASTIRDTYQDEYYARFLHDVDCILFGRNTYQQFSAAWPERNGDLLSEKINTCEKIVFSKTLTKAPWDRWNAATVTSESLRSKVQQLKSLPGNGIVIWGSLSLAQQAMNEDLVDDFHIHVCPVVTAGGRRIFANENRKELKLVNTKTFDSGIVALHYQNIKKTI